ncbi:MAG: hypothetical protein KGJ13_11620, partial [Patescibacteria group bacterium]|nr:hypothetical protein [Patescibacteria group bacterium]
MERVIFDVRGDRILFHGETIATLCTTRVVGWRIEAERALIEWQDPSYLVTEEDHTKEVEEAEARGEKAGYASGFEDGKCEAKVEADEQAEARE